MAAARKPRVLRWPPWSEPGRAANWCRQARRPGECASSAAAPPLCCPDGICFTATCFAWLALVAAVSLASTAAAGFIQARSLVRPALSA